ncbi:MAG TPA: ankyrin repeat domain-containing protein [Solirubrobacter sp.]|nr:ankyrin repeat domain-containing protein [Solirubrobacter sp.]
MHGKTELHLAAEHDDPDRAEALLAAGAELEARTDWGATPLDWAGVLGNRAVADVLIAHGAHLSPVAAAGLGIAAKTEPHQLDDAFALACRNGHTAIARALLAQGARVDARGYFNAPAIHWAAINGHADTVAFLLEAGADPDLKDDEFDADALGWAREGNSPSVVELLDRRHR